MTLYIRFNLKKLKRLGASKLFKQIEKNSFLKNNLTICNLPEEEFRKICFIVERFLILNIHFFFNIKKSLKDLINTNSNEAPYVIGVTGSISSGKSTISKLIRFLLSVLLKKKVDIVNTDSFIYPNYFLEKMGIIHKKGFPVSYNIKKLMNFFYLIKSKNKRISVPIYSHLIYDIVPNRKKKIENLDILIIEGLHILQNFQIQYGKNRNFILSDFIDFSIYIDAKERFLKRWYIDRFLDFCKISSNRKNIYSCKYSKMRKEDIIKEAKKFWDKINTVNLKKNILPIKDRANLVITKEDNHIITDIKLKK
ncbi:hypothetical protein AOQ88_01520 [Candidatus Riesia sp. GBBU]|nr:hypothetical protein AOQ88_01520 [Candidatus Riesia sp. GBBU]